MRRKFLFAYLNMVKKTILLRVSLVGNILNGFYGLRGGNHKEGSIANGRESSRGGKHKEGSIGYR